MRDGKKTIKYLLFGHIIFKHRFDVSINVYATLFFSTLFISYNNIYCLHEQDLVSTQDYIIIHDCI